MNLRIQLKSDEVKRARELWPIKFPEQLVYLPWLVLAIPPAMILGGLTWHSHPYEREKWMCISALILFVIYYFVMKIGSPDTWDFVRRPIPKTVQIELDGLSFWGFRKFRWRNMDYYDEKEDMCACFFGKYLVVVPERSFSSSDNLIEFKAALSRAQNPEYFKEENQQ